MFREKYCLLLIIDYVAKLPSIIDIVAKNDTCHVFNISISTKCLRSASLAQVELHLSSGDREE